MKRAKKSRFPENYHRMCHVGVAFDEPSPACLRDVRHWIWIAAGGEYSRVDIGVVFCDEAYGRAANAQYRQKDYATNVLSFAHDEYGMLPESEQGCLHGDLIICMPVVAREAAEQGKSIRSHLAHLVIHGTLHLMGYDHIDDADAQVMENLEVRCLNRLGYPDPYQ